MTPLLAFALCFLASLLLLGVLFGVTELAWLRRQHQADEFDRHADEAIDVVSSPRERIAARIAAYHGWGESDDAALRAFIEEGH